MEILAQFASVGKWNFLQSVKLVVFHLFAAAAVESSVLECGIANKAGNTYELAFWTKKKISLFLKNSQFRTLRTGVGLHFLVTW